MLIQGAPIVQLTSIDADLADRFWFWQGHSGRKYIHSVYAVGCCPPLPGAVYVGVKRLGHLRVAMVVGRFQPFWDRALSERDASLMERLGVDEVHVHLLARGPEMANAVKQDLSAALVDASHAAGLNEPQALWVNAA